MESVYILWHLRDPNGEEDEKLIGVYRSEEDAKAAIERLKDKPGFKETRDAFEIHRYLLNRDGWQDGFVRAEN